MEPFAVVEGMIQAEAENPQQLAAARSSTVDNVMVAVGTTPYLVFKSPSFFAALPKRFI
jgi:hypothetical protein